MLDRTSIVDDTDHAADHQHPSVQARLLSGVYKLPNALLRILDVSAIVAQVMSRCLENVVANDERSATSAGTAGR